MSRTPPPPRPSDEEIVLTWNASAGPDAAARALGMDRQRLSSRVAFLRKKGYALRKFVHLRGGSQALHSRCGKGGGAKVRRFVRLGRFLDALLASDRLPTWVKVEAAAALEGPAAP